MLLIRPENSDDVLNLRFVQEQAFNRPHEANLVDNLRCRGVVSLSLVAIASNHLVGHILFTPVTFEMVIKGVGLAPIAVLPHYQRQGIGSQLVTEGLLECEKLGYDVVVVLGDPNFYARFGFNPAASYGLKCVYDAPAEAFMVKELVPNALKGITGVILYQKEFDTV